MPAIDEAIFSRQFPRRASEGSNAVQALCRHLSPGQEPVLLPLRPSAEAMPQNCFHNVRAEVERNGGEIIYGWALWIWPRVFIEAEHHAVWSCDGELRDVTPREDEERQVLFLPDPSRVYDFATERRIDNQRFALSKSGRVQSLLSLYSQRTALLEQFSNGRLIHATGDFQRYFADIQDRILQATAYVLIDLATTVGRNEECICASGLKFKKCCAPLIDLNA